MSGARFDPAALRDSPRPRVLMVLHAGDGGVERHVRELSHLLADGAEVLWLRPRAGKLALSAFDREGGLYFDDCQALVAVLEGIGIDRVHVHHVDGLPVAEVLALPRRLGVAYDVTLHDYYAICPEYHLVGGDGRFCGGAPTCQRCHEAKPPAWNVTIEHWRGTFWGFLERAARVIAPSHDAAARVRRHFPVVPVQVWPHPRVNAPRQEVVRVLVPGALSPIKGLGLLEACVRDAAGRGLPLHFRVVGFTASAIPHAPQLPLSITGQYEEGGLPAMLAAEKAHVAFFPAQCPETFSFTLDDVLDTDLPVVATDLGALPERLAARDGTRIVRWDASAAQVNDALLAAARPRTAPFGRAPDGEAWIARYRQGWPERAAGARASLPALRPEWSVEPAVTLPPATLAWLYEDGVLCGRTRSRERLRRQAAEADSALVQLREALEETGRERDRARAELARIHRSRSWKLTAPIRALARRLRGS